LEDSWPGENVFTSAQKEQTKPQIAILYAGRDPVLLLVRRLLLEYAGYIVTTAATYPAFIKEFYGGDFDGVVLCSSIKNSERRKMAALVRDRSPSVPVVVISESSFSQHDFGTLSAEPQPEALLNALAEALKGRHHRRSA
jgi:CheY-like chemotaxis protein